MPNIELSPNDIDHDDPLSLLKSKILDVGKELHELNLATVQNNTEDDIIQAVIASNNDGRGFNEDDEGKEGNLKLFFGHENWNLMMNMLIGKVNKINF
jgi:hypothetical protein